MFGVQEENHYIKLNHQAELIFSKEQCEDLVDALKWAKNKYHLENKD
jgi:hypothetical protein